jgi:hypothetical protein
MNVLGTGTSKKILFLHQNIRFMKLTIWTILIISSLHFSAHSQLFLGVKSGYNRYFDPGMNGGNIALFTELPFGEYYSSSVRASLFYDFPMKTEDVATLYSINDAYSYDGSVPVTSWYKNIGISVEYLHYFYDDAFATGLYSVVKGGLSYSSITRKTNGFDLNVYYQTDHAENNKQLSIYFGVGLGFQFSLGPNSLLFTEIHGGFPFFSMRGNDAGSSMLSGYPPVTASGIVGFKRSIFN